jgi:hypothetical protein
MNATTTTAMNEVRQLLAQARISSAKFAAKPRPAFKPLIANPQAGGSYRIAPTPANIAFFERFPA